MPSTSNNDQLFEQGGKEKLNVLLLDSFMNFVSSSFDFVTSTQQSSSSSATTTTIENNRWQSHIILNKVKTLWNSSTSSSSSTSTSNSNIIESQWELFLKSKFSKYWLPELSYLDGWTLNELIVLIVILLLTCSWYTIRADRINTEELIHHHQDQQKKKKKKKQKQKKKQRGEKVTAAVAALEKDLNEKKESSSTSWPSYSLPSFDSTIIDQLSSFNCISTSIPNIRSLGFSMGTSWERRIQTMSMFSCSLAFVMPGTLVCWITVLHFGLLLPFHVFIINDNNYYYDYDGDGDGDGDEENDYDIPSWYKLKTGAICITIWIYMIHAFLIDTSPTTGSRIAWLRNDSFGFGSNKWNWWEYACDYLPVVLVKTAELPPTQTIRVGNSIYTTPMKYVMGYHPHGIISVGAFCSFATDSVRTLDLSTSSKSTSKSKEEKDENNEQKRRPLRPSALSLLELEEKENKQSSNQNGQRRGFSSLYPNLDRRLVTLPINFTVPFIRDYFLGLGAIDSKKETFRNYLNLDLPVGGQQGKTNPNEGRAMIVVVGGAAESMIAHSNRIELVLQKRRGFVREAIMANACLVPVLGYGETNLYTLHDNTDDHKDEDKDDDDNGNVDSSTASSTTASTSTISKIQKFVRNTFGVAVPLFTGRSIFFKSLGVMPRRSPVVVVVGKPIPPPTFEQLDGIPNKKFHPLIDRTTDEPINNHGKILKEWHTRYVYELEELYNKYKDAKWNQPGKNRQKSMRIVR